MTSFQGKSTYAVVNEERREEEIRGSITRSGLIAMIVVVLDYDGRAGGRLAVVNVVVRYVIS